MSLRRVRRLETDGTIKGYRAELDRRKLGLGLTIFTDVKVTDYSPDRAAGFERAVADVDEIIGCYIVSGSSDFMLEIAIEDLAAHEEFYLHTLLTLPGVYDSNSKIVMRTMKEPGPLPIRK